MTVAVMLLSGCSSEQHGGDSSDGSQSILHQEKKAQTTLFAQRALQERRMKPPDQIIACPRCQSLNTKFCYYNNYSLTQPRHFCKNCRRYWTAGGTLRNVPVGGGCRKNKRAKQPRSSDLSGLSGDPSISGLRSDGVGSALHSGYNPSSASTSAAYYEYDDATKIVLSRAQQSIRAGPSGVSQSSEGNISSGHVSAFHATHGSHPSGISHSGSSFESAPNSMIALSYYPHHQPKQEVGGPGMVNGDLSAILESQNYRAVAAAAAAAGQGGEGAIGYNIDIEAMSNQIEAAESHWRLQHAHAHAAAAQQVAAQKQAVWARAGEEEQREGTQPVQNVDEKGLLESLKQVKGKAAVSVSPSRGHEQSEGAEVNVNRGPPNAPAWQLQQVSDGLQTFEPVSHDTAFWTNQTWAPLDMHSMNPPPNSQML